MLFGAVDDRRWLLKCINVLICPFCGEGVTKISGCNVLYCQKYTEEFCWLCGGKTLGHGTSNLDGTPHACGNFNMKKP